MRKLIFLLFFSFSANAIIAQSNNAHQFNSWWTYAGNHQVYKKWELHTMASIRRNDFLKNWQQLLIRAGIGYRFNKNLNLQIGYDFAQTYPYGEQPIKEIVKEHRIWVQTYLSHSVNRVSFSHRFRLELRMAEKHYSRFRTRYNFSFAVPLNHDKMSAKTVYLKFFDELFINLSQITNNHIFDQNWSFLGIGWKWTRSLSFELGYMNQFISKADGFSAEINHTLKTKIIYNFKWKEKMLKTEN